MLQKSRCGLNALTACTMAVAASLGGGVAEASSQTTLSQITHYCQASWKNAGIRRQEWSDCTQQVLTDLLERIPGKLDEAAGADQSDERRELKRAVWRAIKRCQRRPQHQQLVESATRTRDGNGCAVTWNDIQPLAEKCLTHRQHVVLELVRGGWKVSEIAAELDLPPSCVSDAKYRAIEKLRQEIAG